TNKCKAYIMRNNKKLKDYQSEWRRKNPDKIRDYRIFREQHKNHTITATEMDFLYQYCNYSCMYCGLTERDSLKEYGQILHRDHAVNDGGNGIENCILACKSCNSSKHTDDWDVWFTTDNEKFDFERYQKIYEWLNYEFTKTRSI
ncbi:HNH endonuclease, partial [Paenibacillus polymyxa]|uniref:HNH endonuclease n=1 Tax=Paenibacillus polymyxa TaxID=1406 RepID=UPI001C302ECD